MSLTDIIDSTVEETADIVDELLVSSIADDTLGDLPAKIQPVRSQKSHNSESAPKRSRSKVDSKSEKKLPAKKGTKRKALVADTRMDDDEFAFEAAETQPPKPRARGRPPVNSRVVEVEESGELVETAAPKTKSRKTKANKSAMDAPVKAGRSRTTKKTPVSEDEPDDEPVPSPVNIRSNFTQTKTTKGLPKPVVEKVGKSTTKRGGTSALRPVEEVESDEEQPELEEQQAPPRKRQRTASVSRPEPAYRRRAGSLSDTERGDPMLRRKLGDITRKCENIDAKYRSLKDVGIVEANANVERLRKQCEVISEKSDKLVASLRKELAQQASVTQDSRKLRKDAQSHEAEANRLRTANDGLSSTLTAAQNEIKALQAKLAAAKAAPAPEPVKQPPTISKANVHARTTIQTNTQSQSDRESQLKLALYADLTDLLIRNVRQSEDGDTYDCIQTGRNGSLHFKLFVDAENASKARLSPNTTELEILYTPQIHAERDRELIATMPDYLTEELTFERSVASKFYARVVKTLVEKPAMEHDGNEDGEDDDDN